MLPLVGEWSVLIWIDWLLGKRGWGIPMERLGTWFYIYPLEWLCWFVIPIGLMLYWRYWIRKQPDYKKMDEM